VQAQIFFAAILVSSPTSVVASVSPSRKPSLSLSRQFPRFEPLSMPPRKVRFRAQMLTAILTATGCLSLSLCVPSEALTPL
jgi:hypothetical protein